MVSLDKRCIECWGPVCSTCPAKTKCDNCMAKEKTEKQEQSKRERQERVEKMKKEGKIPNKWYYPKSDQYVWGVPKKRLRAKWLL